MTPNVSILIRSYSKDIPWLQLCLRALRFRNMQVKEIVVVYPSEDESLFWGLHTQFPEIKWTRIKHTTADQYVDQQRTKCHADEYCSGDFVLHVDSDCVLKETLNIRDYFVDGRPKLLFRRWEECGTAMTWRGITKDVLKAEPWFEFMPSAGIMYHRSTHELMRRYVEQIHKMTFDQMIRNRPHRSFSEFNALGNFSHLFTPDAYHFVRAIGPGHDSYPRPFRQFWSHGGVDSFKDELDQIMLDVP